MIAKWCLAIWSLVFLCVYFLNAILSPPPLANRAVNSLGRPLILAHRGSRVLNPENSLLAHRTAVQVGADVLEFDVSLTADGDLVIIHDLELDRLTNGTGPVISKTARELKDLDYAYWFSNDEGVTFPFRGKGVKILLLREILDEFITKDVFLNIELKNDDPSAAEVLLSILEEYPGLNERVAVVSAWCNTLQYFRKISGIHSPFCLLFHL